MVMSFGYRHGAPRHVDAHTFDVRTLTHDTDSPEFLQKYQQIVEHARANPGAGIAIGCEYGQHRSVVLASKVASALRLSVHHRDR